MVAPDDPPGSDGRSLEESAEKVRRHLSVPPQKTASPVLVLVSGLPGSGKSYFTARLAERVPAVVIRTDQVRKILFRKPTYQAWESGVVYQTSQRLIDDYLRNGWNVIFDGTNLTESGRRTIYRIVERTGARLLIVQTTAPENVIKSRLERSAEAAGGRHLSDADWAVYLQMRDRSEPIRRPHIRVDTSNDINPVVNEIASKILEGDVS